MRAMHGIVVFADDNFISIRADTRNTYRYPNSRNFNRTESVWMFCNTTGCITDVVRELDDETEPPELDEELDLEFGEGSTEL